MKFAILTFGCRVNLADSLALERDVRAADGEMTSADAAEVVIVNTCAVTGAAEKGARQAIRRVGRRNPVARLVVTGCYATRQPSDLIGLPGVLRVLTNDAKPELVPRLAGAETGAGLVAAERGCPEPSRKACPEPSRRASTREGRPRQVPLRPGMLGRTVYTLRVQTGCDESCSYCIVPQTRGQGQSMPVSDVVAEVEQVRNAGFRELMLAGVHLGSYGRDLTPPTTLAALLDELARQAPSDLRIRVGSIEPMDLTGEVEAALTTSRVFAPHVHLPLQHASDRLLHAMRRPYTIATYARLVDRLRRCLPDASIGADIIVGFPGEQADDFDQLADYLRQSALTYLHVFPYSRRPGTTAAALPDTVPGRVIRERLEDTRRIGGRLAARFRASQVGSVRDGLTAGDGSLVLTDNYLKVSVAPGYPRNERVGVRITVDGTPMTGEIVGAMKMQL